MACKHGEGCRLTRCEGWAYFSNGTEHEWWDANWCDRCLVDAPYRNDISQQGCPLLTLALTGERVDRWLVNDPLADPPSRVTCLDFKPFGWRNPEPAPKAPPPGQDTLFDPPSGRRMLVQPQEQRKKVLA